MLYDVAQSIYQTKRRKFSFASVGIEARGRTRILKINYRNTDEVLALAVHVARSLLAGAGANESGDDESIPLVQPTSAGRRGAMPVLLQARDAHEEAELIAERIAAARVSGMPVEDIAVLCRAKYLLGPIEQALGRRRVPVQSMRAQRFDASIGGSAASSCSPCTAPRAWSFRWSSSPGCRRCRCATNRWKTPRAWSTWR